MNKICKHCGQDKPIEDFPINKKMTGGFDSWCKACHKEASYQSRLKHLDTQRRYQQSRPDKNRGYTAKYRAKNLDKTRAYAREYARQHPEIVGAYNKAHPEKIVEYAAKRRARVMEAPGAGVTAKQFEELKEYFGHRCAYCGKQGKLTMDHVEPLTLGGAHDISNIVPACFPCNSSKHNKPLLLWLCERGA